YKWWYMDMNNKTLLELPLPVTKGFNTNWVQPYNDNYLLPIGNNNETGIYEYSLSENKVINTISTNGLPICLHKID
ncbi:MAG: hypothetical protein ACOC10_08680, partial [Bacteroidota bacterium]